MHKTLNDYIREAPKDWDVEYKKIWATAQIRQQDITRLRLEIKTRQQEIDRAEARNARLEHLASEAMELINDCINLSRSTGEWHHKADLQQMTEHLVQHRQKLSNELTKTSADEAATITNEPPKPCP